MTTTAIKSSNNVATILLVEDEPINQFVVGEMLKKAGCAFDLAENGIEAFKLATSHLYKLILMDYELPDMTGIEVTSKIRSSDPQNHVPIVALTSHTEQKIKDQCFKSGMDGFANKPINQADLFSLINQYVTVN